MKKVTIHKYGSIEFHKSHWTLLTIDTLTRGNKKQIISQRKRSGHSTTNRDREREKKSKAI
jgi:hypothetical protein